MNSSYLYTGAKRGSIDHKTNLWQKRRSGFNHDWMKNKYLQALDDWMMLLDEKQVDVELERTFISVKLPQWGENRRNVIWLWENFEKEMSPRVLFNELPLSNIDNESKQWLGDLIHAIWYERYEISALLERLSTAIAGADNAYGKLQDAIKCVPGTMNIDTLQPLKSLFADFRTSCGAVASAVEKFPSEVLVP